MTKKKQHFTPRQIYIIQQKKANEAVQKKANENKKEFPKDFPFWARLKIGKNRTTLVIDEEPIKDKKGKQIDGFVHREATHTYNKNFEPVIPNPDKEDPNPMYLKRLRKLPVRLFKPHNKKLTMPEHLRKRYEKNNK